MNRWITLVVSCYCLILGGIVSASTSEEAFQKLLSLEGQWEGQYDGQTIRLTYEPISQKTALLETMVWVPDGSAMTTIYHPKGENQLLATHYCHHKNQPRLVANLSGLDQLDFQFSDGTNLGKGYVSGILIKFISNDEIEQTTKFEGNSTIATVRYKRMK